MAAITAQSVKSLRERTGAGMMDCKRALTEADGDVERAIEVLRERGLAKAVKRAGRETTEGAIAMALQGPVAGILELGCETDFVAKTGDFQALAARLAAAVASHPEVKGPEELLAVELEGSPVSDWISQAAGRLGENVVVKRVARLAVEGEGVAGGYIHAGGKLGVVVGLATTAPREPVAALAKDLAMHVAAADPSPVAVDRAGVSKELVDREAEIFRRQAEQEGKPAAVIEKIVEGRVRKLYKEICLLEQPFVKDPDKSVQQFLDEAGEGLGSPVQVTGFVRFRLGESAAA